ncbi:sensor kinase protein [Bordetella bronchiseptica 1289]|uniref:sensor histidine kinase n=1 Tax=Bordetella bronchiseptica TaxID=518 RepID=UPI00028F94B7|nr:HAMP domain-containing sensor histidine kinase [Bordetella bronchiseptica]CCN21165.1 sensor kinase protein [Bordetella bronchiseptica 1289]
MTCFLRRLWNSISFRLTLNYGLMAILTTLILIVFIYAQFIGALRTEYTRQITSTAQRLEVAYEEGGRNALAAAIELTLSDRIDADREIYLLLDEHGRKIAGNLDESLPLDSTHTEVYEADIVHDAVPTRGHLKVLTLGGGETLVVGHDSSEIGDITSLIGRATATAILLAVLLVLLGTYIFRRELARRVSHIRQTTQQIGAGQLSKRISASTGEDEFTLLNRDVNAMLDRIELLMKSARHISDTIAHNLRTPLTRIVGALRTARRPGVSMAEVLDANQHAIESIERLNVLLEKLLQIAELEAGIQRRSFRPCELDVIVADVLEMYGTLAEEKGVSLLRAKLDNVTLHGDANLLASALANLIDNAVKFAVSQVVVDVTRQNRTALVTITDDGAGLPPAEYEHLGKHFYRSDPSSEGHGLGLTSVKSIVGLHVGTLGFSDARPGLRVAVSLPLDPKSKP